MIMQERSEMPIPKCSYEFIVSTLIGMIVFIATATAALLLFFRVTIIAPCIWLAFVAWRVWATCKYQGSPRKCLINFLGFLARKQFVESIPQDTGSVEIRFGYQLFGHRLFYFKVPLDKIETVKWSPGQAPRFWNVCIWFDHPEKSPSRDNCTTPENMGIYCVGPSRRKKRTEAFGLAFVDFLRRAGATMVRGKDDCTFVWAKVGATEGEERRM